MNTLKNLFNNLDTLDLKIMKIGLKFCFVLLLIALAILLLYLFFVHTVFLYNLGLALFRLSSYFSVEFIICGIVADMVKKQIE